MGAKIVRLYSNSSQYFIYIFFISIISAECFAVCVNTFQSMLDLLSSSEGHKYGASSFINLRGKVRKKRANGTPHRPETWRNCLPIYCLLYLKVIAYEWFRIYFFFRLRESESSIHVHLPTTSKFICSYLKCKQNTSIASFSLRNYHSKKSKRMISKPEEAP